MTPAPRLPPPSDPARYVHVPAVRCPGCGSDRLRVYKTQRDNGTVSRWTKCRACGSKFIVVYE